MSDHATIKALQDGVDQAVRQAEAKWGVDRLAFLVTNETRERFYRQQNRWRTALENAWNARPPIPMPTEQALRAASGGMVRAWAALDAEAVANGHAALSAVVWEVKTKEGLVAFVQTTAEALSLGTDRYRAVFTTDEIGALIDALPVLGLKAEFPGAQVQRPRERRDFGWVADGDEIPF